MPFSLGKSWLITFAAKQNSDLERFQVVRYHKCHYWDRTSEMHLYNALLCIIWTQIAYQ